MNADAMASEVLISISKDEVERARLMSEYKFEVDHQSKMVHARRQQKEEDRQEFLALLKNGKSPDEIIQMYETK
jgi:hypothetical protein